MFNKLDFERKSTYVESSEAIRSVLERSVTLKGLIQGCIVLHLLFHVIELYVWAYISSILIGCRIQGANDTTRFGFSHERSNSRSHIFLAS